jgi:hypothetical protein
MEYIEIQVGIPLPIILLRYLYCLRENTYNITCYVPTQCRVLGNIMFGYVNMYKI